MRLWHYDLFEYLPKQQLISQWRELNSIYVKQDKHILINFIYEYDKVDLLIYSQWLLQEMDKRGYKYNLKNYYEYFKDLDQDDVKDIYTQWIIVDGIFERHMNKGYLHICCWNLYEKLIRGQKGFTREAEAFIYNITCSLPFGK